MLEKVVNELEPVSILSWSQLCCIVVTIQNHRNACESDEKKTNIGLQKKKKINTLPMPIKQKQTAQEGKSTDYCCFKTHLS